MKAFDFYEFAGILVPGAMTLTAIVLVFGFMRTTIFAPDLTVGDLGLFVVLAYAAGHLTQAIGNGVERLWWRAWQGMPSDWIRTRAHHLLGDTQLQSLPGKLASELNIHTTLDAQNLSARDWYSITRQVYAEVSAQSRNNRVDSFNGNYGLNRGIASALLIGLVLLLIVHGLAYWQIILALIVGIVVALYRVHRFGVLYARELFVQFLQLRKGERGAGDTSTRSVQKNSSGRKQPEP